MTALQAQDWYAGTVPFSLTMFLREQPRFALMMNYGPGEREPRRLLDFLESLLHHESAACAYCILINDGQDKTALQELLKPFSLPIVILENPRSSRGWGWGGGLTTGMLTTFRWIAEHDAEIDFVFKADTDTFILGPFSEQLAAMFNGNPNLGATGHYFNPAHQKVNPHSDWRRQLRKLRAPLGLWRKPTWHVRFALCGRPKQVRNIMDEAFDQGYQIGEFCSGGALGISKEAIQRFQQKGWLDDLELFLSAPVTDDVIMGMLVRGTGLKLVEAGRNIFGTHISFFDSKQAILDADCRILHPVKCARVQEETEMREHLRQRSFGSNQARMASTQAIGCTRHKGEEGR